MIYFFFNLVISSRIILKSNKTVHKCRLKTCRLISFLKRNPVLWDYVNVLFKKDNELYLYHNKHGTVDKNTS